MVNHITNNMRRSACSNNEGDIPTGDFLGLTARPVEATSNFAVIPSPLGRSDEDAMISFCCEGAAGEVKHSTTAGAQSALESRHHLIRSRFEIPHNSIV